MSGWTDSGRVCTAVVLCLLLTGCAPETHEDVLTEYLVRVARVAEGDVILPPPAPRPPYPPHRDLAVPIPEQAIDVGQFFELHGCDMGDLVGLRNSPLGRLQAASQRLGYEAAWLQALGRCGEGAAAWMTELAASKRETLPALFWNATFAAAEMRVALGSARPPAGGDLADILRGLGDSFDALEQGTFDLSRLEQHLARLRQGSWAGPAREAWSVWRRHLDAAAALLEHARPDMCLTGKPTPRSRRLQNVFGKFYVEQIQPELARRMRRQEAWLTELERLGGRLAPVQPAAFTRWLDALALAPDSEWQRTRRAVVAHAEAWQALFAHCGIEPGPGLGQD